MMLLPAVQQDGQIVQDGRVVQIVQVCLQDDLEERGQVDATWAQDPIWVDPWGQLWEDREDHPS